jgi:hypothetical protein
MPSGCRYFERVRPGEIDSADFQIPHVAERDWRLPQPFPADFLRREQDAARALSAATDRALVSSGALGVPIGYGGLIGWALKMREDPGHAQARLFAEAEAYARRIGPYLQAVGDYLDVLVLQHPRPATRAASTRSVRAVFVPACASGAIPPSGTQALPSFLRLRARPDPTSSP